MNCNRRSTARRCRPCRGRAPPANRSTHEGCKSPANTERQHWAWPNSPCLCLSSCSWPEAEARVAGLFFSCQTPAGRQAKQSARLQASFAIPLWGGQGENQLGIPEETLKSGRHHHSHEWAITKFLESGRYHHSHRVGHHQIPPMPPKCLSPFSVQRQKTTKKSV